MYIDIVAVIIAWIAAYRCGAFVHEIVHQRHNGRFSFSFTLYWNLTMGLVMQMPSVNFNNHLKHHQPAIFSTSKDPQYPLVNSSDVELFKLLVIAPLLLPLINLAQVHLSMLMQRQVFLVQPNDVITSKEKTIVRYLIPYYWIGSTLLIIASFFNFDIFLLWYVVSAGAWWLSALRIPLEHGLEYHRPFCNRGRMLADSTENKPNWWRRIIQPLGLTYHRTHHGDPTIPYHSLKDASNLK